MGPSRNDVTS